MDRNDSQFSSSYKTNVFWRDGNVSEGVAMNAKFLNLGKDSSNVQKIKLDCIKETAVFLLDRFRVALGDTIMLVQKTELCLARVHV